MKRKSLILEVDGGREPLDQLGGHKVRTNRDHLHKDKPLFVDELIARSRKYNNAHKAAPKKKDNLKLLSLAIANYFEYNKKQEKKALIVPQRDSAEIKKKPATKYNSLLEPKPVANLEVHAAARQRTYIHYEERGSEIEEKTNAPKNSTSIPRSRPNGLNDNTPKANTWRISMHEGGGDKPSMLLTRDKTIPKMLHPSQSHEKRIKHESFNKVMAERQEVHHKKSSVFTACINSINKRTEINVPKTRTPKNGGCPKEGTEPRQVYRGMDVEQKGYFYKPDLKKKDHETKLSLGNKFEEAREIKSMLEPERFNNKENISANLRPARPKEYEREGLEDQVSSQPLKLNKKIGQNTGGFFGKLIRRNNVDNAGISNTGDQRADSSLAHRKKKSMMPILSEERDLKEKARVKRPNLGMELLSKKWKQVRFLKGSDTDKSLSEYNRSEGVIIDKSKLSSESSLVALGKELVCQEENLNLNLSSARDLAEEPFYALAGLEAEESTGEGERQREEYHFIYDEDLYRNLLASERGVRGEPALPGGQADQVEHARHPLRLDDRGQRRLLS
jgi:hypothetical protein